MERDLIRTHQGKYRGALLANVKTDDFLRVDDGDRSVLSLLVLVVGNARKPIRIVC